MAEGQLRASDARQRVSMMPIQRRSSRRLRAFGVVIPCRMDKTCRVISFRVVTGKLKRRARLRLVHDPLRETSVGDLIELDFGKKCSSRKHWCVTRVMKRTDEAELEPDLRSSEPPVTGRYPWEVDGVHIDADWLAEVLSRAEAQERWIVQTRGKDNVKSPWGDEVLHLSNSTLRSTIARQDVRHVVIEGDSIERENLRAFLNSAIARKLHSLSLARLGLDDSTVKVLAAAENLRDLAWLDLSYNSIDTPGVEALATAPFLTSLRYVNLEGNPADRVIETFGVDPLTGNVVASSVQLPSRGRGLEQRVGRRIEWLHSPSQFAHYPPLPREIDLATA